MMHAKLYAERLIAQGGFEYAKGVAKSVNTKVLATVPDLLTTNKKKQTVKLTDNVRTARFFDNVSGYLKNLERSKIK